MIDNQMFGYECFKEGFDDCYELMSKRETELLSIIELQNEELADIKLNIVGKLHTERDEILDVLEKMPCLGNGKVHVLSCFKCAFLAKYRPIKEEK